MSDNTPPQPADVPPVPPAYPQSAPYGAPPAPSYPAPPQQQQQYGAAPYGYGAPAAYPYAATPRTNGLAITSLVASIANFVVLPFIAAIVAVVTGHMALRQLRTSGEGGRGMALAGTIVGWVGVAFGLLFIIFMIWIFAIAGSSAYNSYTYSS